jgi:hypothetical protein
MLSYTRQVCLAVAWNGLPGWIQHGGMAAWLQDNLLPSDFAQHPDSGSSFREAFAVYFRRVSDAQRFVNAFPGAELADGIISTSYTTPALPSARKM